jgi:hypothetical protein
MLKELLVPRKRKARPRSGKDGLARRARIAETAYFLAEKRGFEPGGELDDWFRAENIVDAGAERGLKG